MNRNHLIIGGLGLAIVLLALLLKDFVREMIIIPIFKLVQFIDDLPQDVIWFFAIGVMVFFAYKSLIHWKIPRFKGRSHRIERPGQIEVLAGLIRRSHRGGYFRERLVQYLCGLILDTLAYRERVTPELIKERLNAGTMDVPDDVLAYLRIGLNRDSHLIQKRKKMFLQFDDRGSALELDLEQIVKYLESQVE